MKITKVTILYVHSIKTDASQSGQRPILLRIDTDKGIYGIGEVGMAYGTGGHAAVGMLRDYAEMIIGMDPMNTEAIWEKFLKTTFWGQGGGTVIFGGMSGIDIALWDIKGKALGVPVYQLLGGKCRSGMRTYASQIQLAWAPVRNICKKPEDFAREAMVAVNQGYDAVKADVLQFDENGVSGGYWLEGPLRPEVVRVGEARIRAIREAVGPDVDIIVENHAHTDTVAGVQFAKAIEKYNIMFYEELNSPLNSMLSTFAKNHINIPIAAGERIYTRWGFRPFLEARSLDVIQPDLGICGGITEIKKICDMAHVYDVTVQVHVAGTAVACAAALNVEAAIPNFCIHEHHQKALMPEYIQLCTQNYQPVNGMMPVPELPGIGQDLTAAAYQNSDLIVVE
ncbi:MAG: mandelate racemase/muconate lactonizing enzyme family protein [Lawsonibacter sp.]|nr:mandelate racemase/muconate lactonizing enzyme family protein [Lawsonibacter sp.]